MIRRPGGGGLTQNLFSAGKSDESHYLRGGGGGGGGLTQNLFSAGKSDESHDPRLWGPGWGGVGV